MKENIQCLHFFLGISIISFILWFLQNIVLLYKIREVLKNEFAPGIKYSMCSPMVF